MSISGIYAVTNQVTNGIISTDIVDIELTSFEMNENNEEIEYETTRHVIPGEEISITPKVYNHGMDCYLRIKVKYINENLDFMNYVTGFSEKFTKYGDYYYYSDILQSDESIKIFETIKIPEEIRTMTDSDRIKLEIVAEAIQGRNFEPDYTLADPWKNIKPSKTINNTYCIDEDSSHILINYEDNTDKSVFVSDNFFVDARKLVPGDEYTDSIKIKNNNAEKAKYYIKMNTDGNNIKERKLLESLKLIITKDNGDVIYDGNFIINEKILLGEYSLGEEENIYFKVKVPFELDNQYENLNSKLLIIFFGEYNGNESKQDSNTIKTGDSIDFPVITFLISAIGLIIVMILFYRENKKININ